MHGLAYRQDIDGLRGVSVAAVVLFHAFPDVLRGGFAGVDVFFVISGFLITSLLLRERCATGAIDLVAFWGRRIRRILPAATTVLVACLVTATLVPNFDSRVLAQHVVGASLFYLNWRRARDGAEYLTESDQHNAVLHYWSLAVEEQFYVVWPLVVAVVVYLAMRRSSSWGTGTLLSLTAVAITLSFAAGVLFSVSDPSFAYFGTFTRAWQLLCGALLAIVLSRGTVALPGRVGGIVAAAATALLGASFVLLDKIQPYPGYQALMPTLAAVGLILAGSFGPSLIGSALGWGPLRWLGRISYSLYLWHWPVFVFGAALTGDRVWHVVWIALSVLLAIASYVWIERPIRESRLLQGSTLATYALGAALIAASLVPASVLRKIGPDSVTLTDGRTFVRSAVKDDRAVVYKDGCLVRLVDVDYATCAYGDPAGGRTVVAFGDSHVANWFPALDAAAKQTGWRVLARVKASCRPRSDHYFRVDGSPYPECKAWHDKVLQELAASKPDLIIVTSMATGLPAAGEREMLDRLGAIAPLILTRDTPLLPEPPIDCLSRTLNEAACATPSAPWLAKDGFPRVPPDELPRNAKVVDLNDRVCPDGTCQALVDGRVTRFDAHHFTESFAMRFVPDFVTILQSAESRRENPN